MQIVALVLWCVLFLGGTVWEVIHDSRESKRAQAFFDGRAGRLAAINDLASDKSPDAGKLLQLLGHDRNAAIEGRVAAIKALGGRSTVTSQDIGVFLSIDEPLAVREAAVAAFQQRGCDDLCVTATLQALERMWQGDSTFEMRLAAETQMPGMEVAVARLRAECQSAYIGLLASKPCSVRRIISAEPNNRSFEPKFVAIIQSQVPACTD